MTKLFDHDFLVKITDEALLAPLNKPEVAKRNGVTLDDLTMWLTARHVGKGKWGHLHPFHRDNPTTYPVPKGWEEEMERINAAARGPGGHYKQGNPGNPYGRTGRIKANAIDKLNAALDPAVETQVIIIGALNLHVKRMFVDENFTFDLGEFERAQKEDLPLRYVDLAHIKTIHGINERHLDRVNGKARQRIEAHVTTNKDEAQSLQQALDDLDDETKARLAQIADPLEIDE